MDELKVVISEEVREALGLNKYDPVKVILDENGQVILRPMEIKLWQVAIDDSAFYLDIEAETEEEAIEQALSWWEERQPRVKCTLQKERD